MLQNLSLKLRGIPTLLQAPVQQTIKQALKPSVFAGLLMALPLSLTISLPALSSESPVGPTCEKIPLNILLTNDDGFDKPGIRALHQVFKHAGHRVVLAAPEKNASGSSASITFAAVKVIEAEPDVYAIAGSPATTVLLGSAAFFPNSPPDLVISGINKGANLGPATPVSGTVGATVAAILIAEPGIPAIAVSTDPFTIDNQTSEKADLEHLNRVAEFVLTLVGKLQTKHCDGSALLPPKVALNVNYPPIAHKDIKGVQFHNQGKAPLFSLSYKPSEKDPTIYVPRFAMLPQHSGGTNINTDGDTSAFHKGYITVVAIDGDYTVGSEMKARIAPLLSGLKP